MVKIKSVHTDEGPYHLVLYTGDGSRVFYTWDSDPQLIYGLEVARLLRLRSYRTFVGAHSVSYYLVLCAVIRR